MLVSLRRTMEVPWRTKLNPRSRLHPQLKKLGTTMYQPHMRRPRPFNSIHRPRCPLLLLNKRPRQWCFHGGHLAVTPHRPRPTRMRLEGNIAYTWL